MSLRDVQSLTAYQAFVLWGAYCPEDGTVKMSSEDAGKLR
jgi:hypothetical protein